MSLVGYLFLLLTLHRQQILFEGFPKRLRPCPWFVEHFFESAVLVLFVHASFIGILSWVTDQTFSVTDLTSAYNTYSISFTIIVLVAVKLFCCEGTE